MAHHPLPPNPILEQLLYDMRTPSTDLDEMDAAAYKIGALLGYAIAPQLATEHREVTTLLDETASHNLLVQPPVVIAVLGAGAPLARGIRSQYKNAPFGYLGSARNEHSLVCTTKYDRLPDLENRDVILGDIMLATGGSIVDTAQIVAQRNPRSIIVGAAFATQVGIDRVLAYNPNISIYTAAVDPVLTEKGWISPGLGDAGDRTHGKKIE